MATTRVVAFYSRIIRRIVSLLILRLPWTTYDDRTDDKSMDSDQFVRLVVANKLATGWKGSLRFLLLIVVLGVARKAGNRSRLVDNICM